MSTGGFSDDDLLAALLAEDGFELPDTQAPGAAPRAADAPVTALSAQQRLWMMERIHGARGEFNLGLAVRFGGATPDVAALQALGCRYGQGHLFGRPLAGSELLRASRNLHRTPG